MRLSFPGGNNPPVEYNYTSSVEIWASGVRTFPKEMRISFGSIADRRETRLLCDEIRGDILYRLQVDFPSTAAGYKALISAEILSLRGGGSLTNIV